MPGYCYKLKLEKGIEASSPGDEDDFFIYDDITSPQKSGGSRSPF